MRQASDAADDLNRNDHDILTLVRAFAGRTSDVTKINHWLAVGAVAISALAGFSQELWADDLKGLNGSWQGRGMVNRQDGSKERLRCQASYSNSSPTINMMLTCASDSYKFELQSNFKSDAGKLSGTWSETTRRLQGNIAGNVEGDTVRARVNSDTFSAFLNVRTVGAQQTVIIESPGSTISNVSISLRKS
jgi:hypothetical protein